MTIHFAGVLPLASLSKSSAKMTFLTGVVTENEVVVGGLVVVVGGGAVVVAGGAVVVVGAVEGVVVIAASVVVGAAGPVVVLIVWGAQEKRATIIRPMRIADKVFLRHFFVSTAYLLPDPDRGI